MNPLLQKLGYSPDDRVAVVHADDVGMCQASLAAFINLIDFGLVTTGSTMVPCPWFPSVAALCQNPDVDMGVHITLTCEWDAYRWGPISTRNPASGLMDEEGYFPRTPLAVWEEADADTATRETAAQIDAALAAGIDVTHAEDHMAALLHPRLLPHFVDLLLGRRIPLRAKRPAEPQLGDGEWQITIRRELLRVEAAGYPLFDFSSGLPLDDPENQCDLVRQILERLPPGELSLIVIHPAVDTPELRAIAPDWPSRAANYQAFMNHELRDYVRNTGIHLIGFRPLRGE